MRIHPFAAPLLALAAMFSAGAAQAAACTSNTVLYAATASVGAADGSNWANAHTLQGALAVANGDTAAGRCFEIRVKQGVYKPVVPGNSAAVSTLERRTSFAITRPLQLKGGYTGNSDTDRVLNARNTVLSGDIDNNDTVDGDGITAKALFDGSGVAQAGNQLNGNNSYHVLTVGGTDTTTSAGGPYTANADAASYTLIEWFSITGGRAYGGNLPDYYGGGLFCNGRGTDSICSPSISDATFSGNAAEFGGAIYNRGTNGTSSPTIRNATFSGNSASDGGAIYNDGYISGTSSPTISNATFSGNSASFGGAIYNSGTNHGTSNSTISNTTFSGNSAIYYGGAIYNYGDGGTSSPTITASILWENTLTGTGGAGPQIYKSSAATPTVTNSIVQGSGGSGSSWDTSLGDDGGGNLDSNPWLGTLQDNGGPTHTMVPGADPAMPAGQSSAAIDQLACAPGTTDQRGVPRPQGSACDIGAVERRQAILSVAVTGAGTVSGGLGTCASTSSSCSAPYAEGDPFTATLVATPTAGSTFTGWGGACTNTTGDCVVTMDAARSVTANFALNIYTVTTTANPAEGGGVTCSPNPVNHDSTATCTTTAQPGYMFTGWGGDCSGSGAAATCSLDNVTSDKAVSANFAVVQTSFSGTTVPSAGTAAGPASASFTGGGATCRFDTSTAFVAAPTTLPAGQTMPHGMLKFTLVGCDTSTAPVTMSVTWPAAVQGLSKWGKAAPGAEPTHFAPTGLNVIGNVTTFTVKDGELGDDDWEPNGVIVDPVGATVPLAAAAINPTPVPTLGQWALVLLSLMAAALGMGTLRRNERRI